MYDNFQSFLQKKNISGEENIYFFNIKKIWKSNNMNKKETH